MAEKGYVFYGKSGTIFSQSEAELIGENIKRIILTRRGERINDLSFGSDVSKYIFMPELSIDDLMNEIKNSIVRCESRVTVKSVTLTSSKEERINIDVQVVIKDTNETTDVSVTI